MFGFEGLLLLMCYFANCPRNLLLPLPTPTLSQTNSRDRISNPLSSVAHSTLCTMASHYCSRKTTGNILSLSSPSPQLPLGFFLSLALCLMDSWLVLSCVGVKGHVSSGLPPKQLVEVGNCGVCFFVCACVSLVTSQLLAINIFFAIGKLL